MPRLRDYILCNYFVKGSDGRTNCNNGSCNYKTMTTHAGNLQRHLKALHPEIFREYLRRKHAYLAKKEERKRLLNDANNKGPNSTTSTTIASECPNGNIVKCEATETESFILETCSNEMNISEHSIVDRISESNCDKFSNELEVGTPNKLNCIVVQQAIVELFTKSGHPLDLLRDQPFKILMQPTFEAYGIGVNEQNILELINDFADRLRGEVINSLRKRLLSLKVDVAQRYGITIFGIHVQYVENNLIILKTLTIKELKTYHTSEYIKTELLNVLEMFSISSKQILTLTVDIAEHFTKSMAHNFTKNNSQEEVTLSQSKVREIFKTFEESFLSEYTTATGIQCNQFQCVQDVVSSSKELQKRLEYFKEVSKKLLCENFVHIFAAGRYRKPIIASTKNWMSFYQMLERLLDLRPIVDSLNLDSHSLSQEDWQFALNFKQIFEPLYKYANRLQSENLVFSEISIIIMDIIFQLESIAATCSSRELLLTSFNSLKAKLFDMNLFNAAVFLDPRIKICLNPEQIEKAKQCITSLHKQMASLSYQHDSNLLSESASVSKKPKTLSEYLQSLEEPNNTKCEITTTILEDDLLKYEQQPRLPLNSSILEFWNTQCNDLSAVAEVILAIPCSQGSIERLMSALDYIQTNQINEYEKPCSNLENILFVRVNGEFVYDF